MDQTTIQETIQYRDPDGNFIKKIRGWYRKGIQCYEIKYKNLKEDGEHTWWYENGALAKKESYLDGKRHGTFRRWSLEGDIIYSRKYNVGTLTMG